jgi:Protein of unknown function (DUF3631)
MTVFGRPPLLCSYPIMKTNKKVMSERFGNAAEEVICNQLGTSDQLENGKAEQGRFEAGLASVISHTVELEDVKSQGEGVTNAELKTTKEKKEHLTLRPVDSRAPTRSAHEGPLPDGKFLSAASQATKVPGAEKEILGMTNGTDERKGLLSPALSSLGERESDGMRAVADGRADGAMSDEEAKEQKEVQYLGSAGSEQRKEVISDQWVQSQAEEKESELRARVEAARRVRERSGVFDVAAAETSAPRYADEEESAHGMWEMEEVELWPEPVDGAALLNELASLVRRFVVLPKNAPEALALWVVHTYAFRLRDVSTYLGIESPEKRCGKTTLLTVLSELVHRPVVASNISSPAFFRVIEETRPTLLIDEADTFLQGNDELRGILNSGYSRKTAYVVRVAERAKANDRSRRTNVDAGRSSECRVKNSKNEQLASSLRLSPPLAEEREDLSVRRGEQEMTKSEFGMTSERKEHLTPSLSSGDGEGEDAHRSNVSLLGQGGAFSGSQVSAPGDEGSPMNGQRLRRGSRLMRFSCWCPKVVAAIGRLPETLADRCIVIRMQRKTAHEKCERLRYLEPMDLRRKCARFVADHASEIGKARPVLPAVLNDRAGDIWEPLLVLADLAGGDWPQKARQAAEGLTSAAQESSPIGALLWDILLMFVKSERDRLFSRWMVAWLNEMPDRPWGEMRKGKAVDERWLAQQLRPYGIRSKTMWIEQEAAKGYENEDFLEVYRRYIPRSEYEAVIAEQDERPKTEGANLTANARQ